MAKTKNNPAPERRFETIENNLSQANRANPGVESVYAAEARASNRSAEADERFRAGCRSGNLQYPDWTPASPQETREDFARRVVTQQDYSGRATLRRGDGVLPKP